MTQSKHSKHASAHPHAANNTIALTQRPSLFQPPTRAVGISYSLSHPSFSSSLPPSRPCSRALSLAHPCSLKHTHTHFLSPPLSPHTHIRSISLCLCLFASLARSAPPSPSLCLLLSSSRWLLFSDDFLLLLMWLGKTVTALQLSHHLHYRGDFLFFWSHVYECMFFCVIRVADMYLSYPQNEWVMSHFWRTRVYMSESWHTYE